MGRPRDHRDPRCGRGNLALSALEVEHDAAVVALLTATTVAAAVLAPSRRWTPTRGCRGRLRGRTPGPTPARTPGPRCSATWSRRTRPRGRPTTPSLWQIADLAKRRLRQVHGLRYADDPARPPSCSVRSSPTWSPATDGTATSPADATIATPSPSSASWSGGSRSCDQRAHHDGQRARRRRPPAGLVGGDRQDRRPAAGAGRASSPAARPARGLPGLGKTLAARSFAQSLGLEFTRAQFTPDLLPADLTGSFIYDQRIGEFEFRRGPLFTGLLLADEINRTPPKTQAALLEAMQERQVTVEGRTFPLPPPFHVLATANPVEYEGTYPLPEAQLDRFLLRVAFGYPTARGGVRRPAHAGSPAGARRSSSTRSPTRPGCSRCRRPSRRWRSTGASASTASPWPPPPAATATC